MSTPDELLEDTAEELFEDAPCGYLSTRLDGTIVRVNRTLEQWLGIDRSELVGSRRFAELLTVGGRIYHETHFAPLLQMQGSVREIAVDLVRADGSLLPALTNAVLRHDAEGRPRVVRITVFDATDRRRYEQELVRARERERDIALDLQRSLLAGGLADAEGLDVRLAYRPAVRGLEVGGDWYDAFALDDRATVALAVGDVVGRGIGAAAVMGQLRSAGRALASVGRSPAGVLTGLDAFARRHGVGQMTTIACCELHVGTRELRYACAGHPPPVVAEPGRPARFLQDGRSLPLDAFGAPSARSEGAVTLAPGALLVLYTDGLVERRDESLVAGLDRLLATVDRLIAAPPDDVADAIADALSDRADRADDVCVLAARLTG